MLYFDNTIWLLLLGAAIAGWAQYKVSHTFNKYSKVISRAQIPAHQVAREILNQNGLSGVNIERVAGNLSDHYDPRGRVLRLSQTVYDSTSVAAVGVAAHEVGHAIQHDQGYFPLQIRNMMVPVAQLGSSLSWILILLGLLFQMTGMFQAGIIAFGAIVAFQLITLPVEFNASSRALLALEGGGFLGRDEVEQSRKVLSAAALTYVAAALVGLLQMLRLILIFNRRR